MSTYHKQLRKEFRTLSKSILASKFPATEVEVVKLAWNITEQAAARKNPRRLELHKIFYVYVLLDPRYPGPWVYTLPGGKTITFPFLPMYVGKGNGIRMYDHGKDARRHPKPVKGDRKLNKLRKLHRAGLEVITKCISELSIESVAFAKEIMLIEAIGRVDKKRGPLTNQTDGGEGNKGMSEETRAKHREGMLNHHASSISKNPRYRQHASAVQKALWAAKSDEEKRILADSHAKWNKNLTAEERITIRQKQRQSMISRSPEEKRLALKRKLTAEAAKPNVTCPHCGHVGKDDGRTLRHHFDKCKFK